MIERRGCMAALLHEGYIYVIGGLNYTEKCLKKCERFRLIASQNAVINPGEQIYDNTKSLEKWHKLGDMREARKNASACSMTADTIYVFGGTSNESQTLNSIEQYSIASNRWQFMRIQMPRALCFLTSFKLTPTQVIIMGGSTRETPPQGGKSHGRSYLSNHVYLLDLCQPQFTRLANMPRGYLSLYPAFYDG